LRILLHELDDLLPFLILFVGVLINLRFIHRNQIVRIDVGVTIQSLLDVLDYEIRVVDVDEFFEDLVAALLDLLAPHLWSEGPLLVLVQILLLDKLL